MPVYEFACPKCGAIAADIRSIADYDAPIYCGGNTIISGAHDPYEVPNAEPHVAVAMEHRISAPLTVIVRGGTRRVS
jgi:hypothetical protein